MESLIVRLGNLIGTYNDNVFMALRTAGGLLIGNSALLFFDILNGSTPEKFDQIFWTGVSLVLFASIPFTPLIKEIFKGKKS